MSEQCRDWLSTLWAASYKGVPFYFESDDEEGGRGLVVNEFVNRDDPFVEDLGENARYFSGSAYVHGDNVDSLESSFKQALASRGAGTLVTPLGGPVVVRCETFKRHHEKDKLGFVSFEVKFVREGAASGLISIPFALNVAFGAADAMASAIAAIFPQSINVLGEPDYVISAAVESVAVAASSLDVIRTSYRVEPVASAIVRDAIAGVINDAPAAISSEQLPGESAAQLMQRLVSSTRALADAMPADSAAAAMLEFSSAFTPIPAAPSAAPATARAAGNSAAVYRAARLAGLTAYAEAVLRKTYSSRPEGVTARAEIAERFEVELYETTGAANAALYLAIDALRARVVDYLSRLINDLAPVITVETPRVLPSLFLAWRLYADPMRAPELVARNSVRHPSFMPREITALSR